LAARLQMDMDAAAKINVSADYSPDQICMSIPSAKIRWRILEMLNPKLRRKVSKYPYISNLVQIYPIYF